MKCMSRIYSGSIERENDLAFDEASKQCGRIAM
jgi:hypothetical protein